MGLSRLAFRAGAKPKRMPTAAEKPTPNSIAVSYTHLNRVIAGKNAAMEEYQRNDRELDVDKRQALLRWIISWS